MGFSARDGQPPAFTTRSVEAGLAANLDAGRTGRAVSEPPQFGQMPRSTSDAQAAQNVHSNEQIIAPPASAGRSRSQHSQFGRMESMGCLPFGQI
jgi:hypothetical protein